MVRKARALEMEWYRKMNVYEKRPIEECFEKTKQPSIKVKWVDRNKGDRQHVNVRSRLVAKQINTSKEQGAVRSDATIRGIADASVSNGHRDEPRVLMFGDVGRACMCAREHPATWA